MIEIKRLDAQGRLVLPPSWRKKLKSNEVLVVEDGNLLLIIPKGDPDLSKYLEFVKVDIPSEVYSNYHQLKEHLLNG